MNQHLSAVGIPKSYFFLALGRFHFLARWLAVGN
jgi:hypothetical protein